MTTDYRALCAELAELDGHCVVDCTTEWADVMCRVRAALAQPEPVGPTDEELDSVFHEHCWADDDLMDHDDFVKAARAVLQRWGRPAITPIPVSERLPGPEDCDAEGRLYAVYKGRWFQIDLSCIVEGGFTHWLPASALPLPGQPAPDAPAP